jgi:hypothetical protein
MQHVAHRRSDEANILTEEIARLLVLLEKIRARSSLLPADDEAELRRQMHHINSLADEGLRR